MRDSFERLRRNESVVQFMRLPTDDIDMNNRVKILRELPSKINKAISDGTPIIFHGCSNIGVVGDIIKSGV